MKKKRIQFFFWQKKKYNAKIFFLRINEIRCYGKFEFSKNLIEYIVKIFLKILDNLEAEDFWVFNNSMILAQTFYFIENNEKKYINDFTKSHKIYKSKDNWKLCIECDIKKKIENFIGDFKKKENKQTENAIKEIVFSVLVTFSQNMLDYDFDINEAEEMMKGFMEQYKIDGEHKKAILDNFIKSKNKNVNIEKEKENVINEKDENEAEKKNVIENNINEINVDKTE